jgi:F-box and WD-40 domain protein 1/11
MAAPESSGFLAPGRRASLLSKCRPATSYDDSNNSTTDTTSNRRHSTIFSVRAESQTNGSQIFSLSPFEKPRTKAAPSDTNPFYDEGSYAQSQYTEGRPQTTLLPPHRSPSISLSIRTSVYELRLLGRRMSASVRGKATKTKADSADLSRMSPTMSHQSIDPWQEPPSKSKGKGWFRAPHVRRRPSLPLLSQSCPIDPPQYNMVGPVPGSRHGPPILPDTLQSGAGARAAAAAQNEAFQSTHRLIKTSSMLELLQCQTAGLKLTRDSESGIGIDVQNGHESEEGSIDIVRRDPVQFLATEMVEQILCWLDPVSLLQAERVSREWKVQARSPAVWRHVFHREYRSSCPNSSAAALANTRTAAGLGKKIPDQDWRKMYLVRRAIDQRWTKGEAAAIYLNGHKDSVYCVQFDEHKIITGSRDRTIRVWDTHTYQCTRKIGPPSDPQDRTELELEPVNPQGVFPLFSINTSSPDPSGGRAPEDYHNASILCLQYDNEILVTGSSDFTCIVWSIRDNYKPMWRLRGHAAGVLDVCIDEQYIITCSKDTTIVVWDRKTGELLKRLAGHRGPVNAVQMRSNLLASASGDGMSKLWNIKSGVCIKEFSSRDRGLACVEFSEDGRTIFAGGNDQVIYEYDTNTGLVVRQLRGHKGLVRSLHLDSANDRIVSGSYDMSVKVWDGKYGNHSTDGGLKISFEGWTTSWMLAAKSDYRRIVCTSQDGRVVIIDFGYGLLGANMLEA